MYSMSVILTQSIHIEETDLLALKRGSGGYEDLVLSLPPNQQLRKLPWRNHVGSTFLPFLMVSKKHRSWSNVCQGSSCIIHWRGIEKEDDMHTIHVQIALDTIVVVPFYLVIILLRMFLELIYSLKINQINIFNFFVAFPFQIQLKGVGASIDLKLME
jgi:hypothetical protein